MRCTSSLRTPVTTSSHWSIFPARTSAKSWKKLNRCLWTKIFSYWRRSCSAYSRSIATRSSIVIWSPITLWWTLRKSQWNWLISDCRLSMMVKPNCINLCDVALWVILRHRWSTTGKLIARNTIANLICSGLVLLLTCYSRALILWGARPTRTQSRTTWNAI